MSCGTGGAIPSGSLNFAHAKYRSRKWKMKFTESGKGYLVKTYNFEEIK